MRTLIGSTVLVLAAACHHAPAAKGPLSGTPDGGGGKLAPVETALPTEPAPQGMKWIDRKGDFALAATDEEALQQKDDYVAMTCDVWNLKTHQQVGHTEGDNVSAGGADPVCDVLSPMGTMVEWGNGRNTVWKTWKNEVTDCRGVVAPDDSSCIEDDVTQMMWAGGDGQGDDLELSWAKPVVSPEEGPGTAKVVYKVPNGLDRGGGDEAADKAWWTVRYCSNTTAVIDDPKAGKRVIVDATTGAAKVVTPAPGSPLCP